MSAQESPLTPGPPPRRKEHVPIRENPLRRTSDRFECWFGRFLTLVFVLALPVVALSVGWTAYESSMRTVHAQEAARHEVAARLASKPEGDAEGAKQPAQVRWTDRDGTVRTATTLVEVSTPEGATVRVWVDRDGGLTGPPMNALNATTTGWFVGGMAALGVATAAWGARVGMHRLLDRRRYARWDAEWDVVEPQWSGRSGR
ncbi:hypothetical protein ACIBU0_32615 [Streptomyces sp. NPDC049627]|uniref:Rv1733c family protein n=1 Tax=Streptomyces sp. NPDC049627 TaxID=3365595 RepID=UPI00379D44DE